MVPIFVTSINHVPVLAVLFKYRRLIAGFILLWMLPAVLVSGHAGNASMSTEQPKLDEEFDFTFYGKFLSAVKIKPVKVKSVRENDVLQAWYAYQKRKDMAPVFASLRSLSKELGLNDWFVFGLVRHYVDGLLRKAPPRDRVVLEHFLLAGLGYDVRLGRTEQQLVLLLPIKQDVYEHYFIHIDGKDYYLFYDDLEYNPNEISTIHPCDPSYNNLGKGQIFSLLFDGRGLNMSFEDEMSCDFDNGQIHITCKVSPGVMRMLRDYPVMDMDYYASTAVLPQFLDDIMMQLLLQIEGMDQCAAAEALLQFVQSAFGYVDDLNQFGREKYCFVEENFFYSKNDCDDRSILYAYLVKTLLGLDVQFVHFPGHDCTGVRFTQCPPRGIGYYYGDDYYLICDPSYIGAGIGKCMPEFRFAQPTVQRRAPKSVPKGNHSFLMPQLDKKDVPEGITVTPVEK